MTNLPDRQQPALQPDRPEKPTSSEGEVAATWPCPFTWTWAGIRLGYLGQRPIYAGTQNATLILGPPRSGKTTALIAPAVADAPGPVVSTSTKADVVNLTLPWRQQLGRCWYLDPSGTTTVPHGCLPARWSPIPGCHHWQTAIQRAHALAGDSGPATGDNLHWTERAEALLAPLFHAAALLNLDIVAPLRWVLRRDLTEPLQALTRPDADTLAADTLTGIDQTDERERSGIYSTAARLLAAYRTPTAIATATHPNFDPAAFVHSRDTLYLVAPSQHQNHLAPIIISLLDQIRAHTYTRHRSWPPTLYALDETANIAPLPDLPAIIAEGASQGLLTITCLQDLHQARHRWGRQADGFLTLHANKIALGGISDPDTLRALSTLAGNLDIIMKTSSGQKGLWETTTAWTHTIQQRPAAPPHHIRQLPPGTAYLAHTTNPPVYVTLHQPAPPPRTWSPPQPWTWKRLQNAIRNAIDPSAPKRTS